jgi:hypothetical protein
MSSLIVEFTLWYHAKGQTRLTLDVIDGVEALSHGSIQGVVEERKDPGAVGPVVITRSDPIYRRSAIALLELSTACVGTASRANPGSVPTKVCHMVPGPDCTDSAEAVRRGPVLTGGVTYSRGTVLPEGRTGAEALARHPPGGGLHLHRGGAGLRRAADAPARRPPDPPRGGDSGPSIQVAPGSAAYRYPTLGEMPLLRSVRRSSAHLGLYLGRTGDLRSGLASRKAVGRDNG